VHCCCPGHLEFTSRTLKPVSDTTFNVTCIRENVCAMRMSLNRFELFAEIGPVGGGNFFQLLGQILALRRINVVIFLFCAEFAQEPKSLA
jgi:hypothetical protein